MKFTDKNPLDEYFRSKLEDIQKKPSMKVWENVAKNIDTPGFVKPVRLVSKYTYALLSVAGVAAIAVTAYFTLSSDKISDLKNDVNTFKNTVLTSSSEKKSNINVTKSFSESNISNRNSLQKQNSKTENATKLNSKITIAAGKNNSSISNSISGTNLKTGTSKLYAQNANKINANALPTLDEVQAVAAENNESLLLLTAQQEQEVQQRDIVFIDKMVSRIFRFNQNNQTSTKLPDTTHLRRELKTREELFKMKGFHIAPTYQFNSKWISKQNTYEAFGKYKLAYKLGFGNAYGLAVGYDFSTRFGVQCEYIIHSELGQEYEDIINKKKMTRSVMLDYAQFPLLLKFKSSRMSGLTNKPLAINYIIGMQYARLKSATMVLNGTSTNIRDRFINYDASAVFGMESNIFLTQRFFVSGGFRFQYGLIDINSESWKIMSGGQSHTILSGVNFGLHYMLF